MGEALYIFQNVLSLGLPFWDALICPESLVGPFTLMVSRGPIDHFELARPTFRTTAFSRNADIAKKRSHFGITIDRKVTFIFVVPFSLASESCWVKRNPLSLIPGNDKMKFALASHSWWSLILAPWCNFRSSLDIHLNRLLMMNPNYSHLIVAQSAGKQLPDLASLLPLPHLEKLAALYFWFNVDYVADESR